MEVLGGFLEEAAFKQDLEEQTQQLAFVPPSSLPPSIYHPFTCPSILPFFLLLIDPLTCQIAIESLPCVRHIPTHSLFNYSNSVR